MGAITHRQQRAAASVRVKAIDALMQSTRARALARYSPTCPTPTYAALVRVGGLVALLGVVLGCGGSPPVETLARAPHCGSSVSLRGPLVRLTADEYDATIHDLLGLDAHASVAFPRGADALDLDAEPITPLVDRAYLDVAEALAARAITERLSAIGPCLADGDGSDACARSYIASFGRRAYRRLLSPAEIDRMLALHRAGGPERVLAAMLSSPNFVYRVESQGPLSMHERASRLSYFVWGSTPDDALLDAADRHALGTPDALEAQARRMLEDDRARTRAAQFVAEWLELDLDGVAKDTDAYPDWQPTLAIAMEASSASFATHALFDGSGTFGELFTAPYTFADASAPGILAQPAFLAAHAGPLGSSPSLRGRAIRERVLCQAMPRPPDDVMPLAAADATHPTTRARHEAHLADERCAGCHALIDPIGFTLEHFDGIGRFRMREAGMRIDAHGEIEGTSATDGTVNGAADLGIVLAGSSDVAACVAEQTFRYALRRRSEDVDVCDREALADAWQRSNGSYRELVVAIVRSDAFVARGP
jgi:hypothetical protein